MLPLTCDAYSSVTTFEETETESGILRGLRTDTYRMYLGIRYAMPPTRGRRWKPPQPVPKWQGVVDALGYGASCYQSDDFQPHIQEIKEDCLFLNLYIPARSPPKGSGWPSMVWVHGGSYTGGGGNEPRLNGTFSVALEEQAKHGGAEAIYVTMNYRLGIFGWLGGDALRQPGDNSTGNWGLQDQRAALRWIQSNIAAFGGDPNRTTLFGQSAGAGSVSAHLVAPRSWGLFHRAAMHSGAFSTWISEPLAGAEASFQSVLQAAQCTHGGPKCLRKVSAATLLSIAGTVGDSWGPTIDGVELAAEPWVLAQQGSYAPDIQVMAGSVAEDSTYGDFPSFKADFAPWLQGLGLNTSVSNQLAEIYVGSPPPSGPDPSESTVWWAAKHLLADAEMACPARRTARYFKQAYLYHFAHTPDSALPGAGASHSSDIPFIWHVLRSYPGHDQAPDQHINASNPAEVAMSRQMVDMWSAFAATGDPGNARSEQHLPWPRHNHSSDLTMVLDIEPKGGLRPVHHLRKPMCDYWDTIIEISPQV